MPVVPLYNDNQVALRPVTDAKVQAADFGSSAQQVGAAVAKFGATASDAVDEANRVQDIYDQAATRDAANRVNAWHVENGYHSPDAFFNKGGKDALLAQPEFEKGLDSTITDARESLKNPRQIAMFNRAITPQRQAWAEEIGRHVDKETETYDKDESAGRIALASSSAAAAYLNPNLSEQQIATLKSEVGNYGKLNHWGPDRTNAETLVKTSGVRRDIGTRLAYEGAQGPQLATAYADQHRGDLTADDYEAVQTHARTAQNAIIAEQHRAEAERRRAEREAKSDAADRAEDRLRVLDTGTPLPPQQVAEAKNDAKAAGKPGLLFRIEQADFKNGLNVQYRSATPTEMQQRLNELGPKIKAAGDNPDMKDVVEFQHLSNLRDASTRQLNQDSLSWGAEHMGLRVPPINWSDPGSLSARAQAAQRVASRTGAPVHLLTNEEAASFAPVVSTGSIEEKRTLVGKLAAFGPLGVRAAEQVAPNNPQFTGLIGLATGPDKAAAQAHVNDVLGGQELLKVNSKLIDHKQAERGFHDYAAGSLRLLPTVQAGVLANAKAIFAADASRNGAADWASNAGHWQAAINTALGAYRGADGVRRGGITQWAGAKTVLPDGMSEAEFATKMSRATGEQLSRGSHGTPVWSNGQQLTAGEIRRMQMVPVGNGVYRLTDGAKFVQKKGGGFYELDVNRVR